MFTNMLKNCRIILLDDLASGGDLGGTRNACIFYG